MKEKVDFSKVKTSWTKFDIVQVLDAVYSKESIQKFVTGDISIDKPILRSFLGIKTLQEPIPSYWYEIQKYPKEKKIFALLALIFTHGEIVKEFAENFASNDMTGVFEKKQGKQYTNIRSALVESGAAEPIYRRSEKVPYDISIVFYNPKIGPLFKKVLEERLARVTKCSLSENEFYEVCFSNNFPKALGLTKEKFKNWLSGKALSVDYIQKVSIKNFFSIKNIELEFNNSKEVYFLGENGDGKTLLLMAIYLAFKGNYVFTKTTKEQTGKIIDLFRGFPNIELNGVDTSENLYTISKSAYIDEIYAYGTQRGRYSADQWEKYGFMSLFDSNQTLIDPVYWLKQLKLKDLNSPSSILPEKNRKTFSVITQSITEMFSELLEKNVELKIEGNEVLFIEKGYPLTFDQLSEGYRSVILFITDLLFRLSQKGDTVFSLNDLTSKRGVVLVDEIDLHLHPTWQRKIIKRLRTLLPNIQFFFTTHSPTIIQGASDDAIIYRIYRDNGETKSSELYHRKNLNHLMINTLSTSPLFGMEDSRLDSNNENANTDDNYLIYKIEKKLREILLCQKSEGKRFISDKDLDDLIDNIIMQE